MIEYRRATTDDISLLTRTRVDFLNEVNNISTNTDSEELFINNKVYFENALNNNSFVAWIALDNNEIAATSGLTLYLLPPNRDYPDGKVGYISNMYTLPNFRGQGIASHLFSLIMNEAKSLGYKKVLLNATDAGRSVYVKYGFIDAKGEMVYHF
ncbi:acetyltransferase (GNAT) family protein [Dysgonomonas alginatilytica]|uniref:Acetyltransferase (GNAT) family protein n=1 Tax=Dysgonomonas alginatilytica TaxID=1605892 RepID=A0A2V3PTC9_9BACT|nr:GNAT family N-acetyltransferase [Dysgonomonas alginatilytica]PXV66342.1 acetyltransferase (GNAT) family protein [Dysgonomonas alginatilytica]